MSDGSSCRINEFRRVGHPGTVSFSLYGTEASFEGGAGRASWCTKNGITDVMPEVACDRDTGYAKVHEVDRLPAELKGIRGGHEGSHAFLVDDFTRACVDGEPPPNGIVDAVRYVLPGLMAHESAIRNGERLSVPDLVGAPGEAF